MKTKKTIGYSLVEVMVMLGIIGGISLVVLTLTQTMNKSSAKFELDSDINLITSEITSVLATPANCLAILGGRNALNTAAGIITNINGKFYTLASGSAPAGGYGNAKLNISSYEILATVAEVAAETSYLVVKFENKQILKGTSGPATIQKRINLYVTVDGLSNITSCRSRSTSFADIWERGSTTEIYYNGGTVGVGTTTPQATLDVAGDVKIGNSAPAATTCTVAQGGSTRYNSTSKIMEYCNETNWVSLGGGSTFVATAPIPVTTFNAPVNLSPLVPSGVTAIHILGQVNTHWNLGGYLRWNGTNMINLGQAGSDYGLVMKTTFIVPNGVNTFSRPNGNTAVWIIGYFQ